MCRCSAWCIPTCSYCIYYCSLTLTLPSSLLKVPILVEKRVILLSHVREGNYYWRRVKLGPDFQVWPFGQQLFIYVGSNKGIKILVEINSQSIFMELDTGAGISLIIFLETITNRKHFSDQEQRWFINTSSKISLQFFRGFMSVMLTSASQMKIHSNLSDIHGQHHLIWSYLTGKQEGWGHGREASWPENITHLLAFLR